MPVHNTNSLRNAVRISKQETTCTYILMFQFGYGFMHVLLQFHDTRNILFCSFICRSPPSIFCNPLSVNFDSTKHPGETEADLV